MLRSLLLALTLVASTFMIVADAEAACEKEASGVKKRDRALTPPKNREASEHMTRGNRHFRVQAYEEAIREYTAGALLEDAPVFLYNLGQVFRLQDEYEKAIRQYRLFLDRGKPGQELRALVECHIANMTAELERAASKEPPTGPAPDGPEPVESTSRADGEPPAPERDDMPVAQASPWYADGVGWALAGGGLVATGVGAFLLGDAARLEDDASREDRQDVRASLRDQASSRRTWGVVSGSIGVAVLAAGVVKLVMTPDPPDAREAELSLVVGRGYLGLAGTF